MLFTFIPVTILRIDNKKHFIFYHLATEIGKYIPRKN